MYIDYYDYFLSSPIEKGFRNKTLFLACINCFQRKKDIEPIIEKSRLLGLKENEIQSTVNSAKKMYNEIKNLFYECVNKGDILTNEGDIVDKELLYEHYQYQLKQLFTFGEQICIAFLNDMDKSFTHKFVSYDELVNKEIPDNYNLVKLNPTKNGLSDYNIDKYKHCLIECDNMSIAEQYRIISNSKLPIKVGVYSGGKSIHCICDVSAKDITQYKERAKELYNYAKSIGLEPDENCMSPSKFTRLAGVYRNSLPQVVVIRNNGISYDECIRSGSSRPVIVSLSNLLDKYSDKKENEVVIDGLLRKGQSMMLFGDSKSGKTFLLIQLALAFSYGGEWLKMDVRKGGVLYINMEVDDLTMVNRFKDVMKEKDYIEDNVYLLNYRGFETDIEKLIEDISKELEIHPQIEYIIIDPVYKISRDENSSVDTKVMFRFFDRLMNKGYTIIFCHHTHKNYRGQSITEQFSGSSVYARAVDTLVSVVPSMKYNDSIFINYKCRSFPDKSLFVKFNYPVHEVIMKYDK